MLRAAILISVILWLSFLVAHAEESSTYNFYFQKAPGPVTVNQGSGATSIKIPEPQPAPGSAPATALPTPAAAPVSASVAEALSASDLKRWHLALSYLAPIKQSSYEEYPIAHGEDNFYLQNQLGVSAEYDLTQKVSVSAGVYSLKRKPDLTMGLTYDGAADSRYVSKTRVRGEDLAGNLPQGTIDYSLGFAIHMARSVNDIFDLSLLGGIVSLPHLRYREFVRNGRWVTSAPNGIDHRVSPYGGLRMRLLADRFWGLEAAYKIAAGPRTGSFELGTALQF